MSRREKPYAIVTEGTPAVRRLRSTLIAVATILVLALVWLAASVGSDLDDLESKLATAGTERAQLRTDLTAQQSALDEANQRLVDEGLKPVTEPPVTGPAGASGRPPTAREIRDAVTAYCTDNQCRGSSGNSVTPAQVAQAVATYCDSRGECRGRRGNDGSNGVDGQNGIDGAVGAQGPPPTDAQVAAAVAAFCAGGACRGLTGLTGPPGPPGSQGIQGDPGPTCPPNFTPQQRLVITDDGPEQALICVAT